VLHSWFSNHQIGAERQNQADAKHARLILAFGGNKMAVKNK